MRSLPRRRGFALIIVVVLGVAMVVVAVAMTLSSGSQAIASIHVEGAELARLSAESGLARAEAFAIQTLKNNGSVDFDRVLDPDLTADCAGLDAAAFNIAATGSTPKAGATTFLPKFTDGTSVDYPSGRKWMRVTRDRGAYLVRYEDNADDGITPAGDWSARTGNNAGLSCNEGSAQADNPARDRDGAIWVHVMGIYPGTNPATAVHRVLLRKLLRLPAGSPGQAAFSVQGNVDSNVGASNNVASLVVGGNVTSTRGFCGRVSAGGTSSATANSACSPTPNPFVNESNVPVTPKTVRGPLDASWYDWTTPCNFYVKPGVGLFYWDAAATRGGVDCNRYAGDMVAPNPDVTQTPDTGSCWTPIILYGDPCGSFSSSCSSSNNVAFPYEPFENSSRDNVRHVDFEPSCAGFKPSAASTSTYVDPGTGYSTGGYTSGTSSIGVSFRSWFTGGSTTAREVTVPNFSACSVAGSPSELKWPTGTIGPTTPALATQPGTFTRLSCSPGCDGSRSTLRICPSPSDPDGALQFVDNAGAYVVGVVYKEGKFFQGPGFSTTPEPTSVNGAKTNWPMFTLIVEQDFIMNVNDKLYLGIGTKKGDFPSLVVGGNLDASAATGGATLRLLGGLYVVGNVSMKKNLVMHGPVAVQGNMEALSGGGATWDYDYDFFGNGVSGSAAPQPIVTFPVGF